MTISITSEIGRLREAIMHRPGHELARMTPSTRDYFLFDDLLSNEHARQEHDWFSSVLRDRLDIKIHYLDTLLAESFAEATNDERSLLIRQVRQLESDLPPVEQRVGQLEVLVRWFQGQGWPQYSQDPEGDPEAAAPGSLPNSLASLLSGAAVGRRGDSDSESLSYLHYRLQTLCEQERYDDLARDLIEGIESRVALGNGNGGEGSHGSTRMAPGEDADALRRFVEGRLFHLTPLPNLMFVHDVATVVSDQLLLSRMAAPGRAREPLLLDFVHRNHPRFRDIYRWTWADARVSDPAWPVASSPSLHLEGGNVVQLREDLIVLGVGRRSSMESVQRVADAWRAHAATMRRSIVLYVLRLPAGFNHLDSVFGMISPDECVVYPPVFEPYGPASVDVVRAELGRGPVQPVRSDDFFDSLRRDGIDLTPIPCGGDDPMDQQREQWFSAANLLAVASGKVIIYRSSEKTIEALATRGYRVVDINDLHDERQGAKISLDEPGKWVLKIKGSELSRGHGGPSSLVLPLMRDAI